MGAENDVLAGFREFLDEFQHLGGHLGIECGGGFVEKQNFRLTRDGAGDADALLLAAGQLRGQLFGVVEQAESGERLFRHFMRFGGRVAVHFLQRQRDVPAGGEMGKQVELLEEKPVFSAIRLERRGI